MLARSLLTVDGERDAVPGEHVASCETYLTILDEDVVWLAAGAPLRGTRADS